MRTRGSLCSKEERLVADTSPYLTGQREVQTMPTVHSSSGARRDSHAEVTVTEPRGWSKCIKA